MREWLNVARVLCPTRVNGPGARAAVWVQGCTLRCRGCFNPETHAHEARQLLDPRRLGESLAGEGVEGLTLLGGEPFQQAAASAALAEAARAGGLSVITYSGYAWSYLRDCRHPDVRRLVAASDVLVTGPWVEGLREPRPSLRGSTNQEFVLLTDRYRRADLDLDAEATAIEVRVGADGLVWTGQLGAVDRAALHGQAVV
jgi:anaerobic ribonucleoside-triphosphate reductase activating protein